jgi:hypothetical protein
MMNANMTPTAVPTGDVAPKWAGWITFAGVMLLLIGGFNLINGLAFVIDQEQPFLTPQGAVLFDASTWGWFYLGIGLVQIAAGVGLFSRRFWAVLLAIVFVTLNALAQMAFLPAYPVGATVILVLDVVVLWALVVHGGDGAGRERGR